MSVIVEHAEFEQHHAALEFVVRNISLSINLLQRIVDGEIVVSTKDRTTLKLVTTHYVINNFDALFHERKDTNSLLNISKRFEHVFPKDFFSEFNESVEVFRRAHSADLKWIGRNRNLSTSHFGGGKNERLGLTAAEAARLDAILGGQTPVARKKHLRFITSQGLLQMSITKDIRDLEYLLEQVRQKMMIETWNRVSKPSVAFQA